MYVTDDIITYLGDHASIAAVLKTDPLHIFAGAIPKKVLDSYCSNTQTGEAYIMLEENSGDPVRHMGGVTTTRQKYYIIRVTAPTKKQAHQIYAALSTALEVFKLTMGDMWVEHSFLSEPEDTSSTRTDGNEALTPELSGSLEMLVKS